MYKTIISYISHYLFDKNETMHKQTKRQPSKLLTFPRAQAEVAISRTKLSPCLAGAARLRGFVPSTACEIRIQNTVIMHTF